MGTYVGWNRPMQLKTAQAYIKQGRRLFSLDIHSGAQLVKYEFEIF